MSDWDNWRTVEITSYPCPVVLGQEIIKDGKVVAVVTSSRMFNSEAELLEYIAQQQDKNQKD